MEKSLIESIGERVKAADDLYVFHSILTARNAFRRDYGTGELYTIVEIHTIAAISEHEGITGSELAKLFFKTKGAITQIVSKLEEKGLIRKEKDEHDKKCIHLYLTPKGKRLQEHHILYDVQEMTRIHEYLERTCTQEEIRAFYKVMNCWSKLYKEELG